MIRPAAAADTPTIARLIRALAEYERLTHADRFDEQQLAEHLFGPRPCAEVLLAEESATVVGFALFFPTFSTCLGKPGIWLEDLFVLREHRSRGHGKALLAAVARRAVERGCGWLEWAVVKGNEPAVRFYRARGVVPLDDWTVYRLTEEQLAAAADGG